MKITKIKVGLLECNCYLIEKNNKYLLVDPGDDLEKIEEFINGKDIQGILITHSHFDHIASAYDLEEKYNYTIYDLNNLKEGINKINEFKFEVIKTFGHTMDSICYYFKEDKIMFTGDFLFHHTIGRTDLPESNHNEMLKSLDKIKKYPKDITIYPGHGRKSTLEEEFKNNPYL
ncbi:MAG: MBL fold metallo-hydrolase [Bacilli bacterium]|nr:MBL fold metallo-hydrolase [Bacilli bacterium]